MSARISQRQAKAAAAATAAAAIEAEKQRQQEKIAAASSSRSHSMAEQLHAAQTAHSHAAQHGHGRSGAAAADAEDHDEEMEDDEDGEDEQDGEQTDEGEEPPPPPPPPTKQRGKGAAAARAAAAAAAAAASAPEAAAPATKKRAAPVSRKKKATTASAAAAASAASSVAASSTGPTAAAASGDADEGFDEGDDGDGEPSSSQGGAKKAKKSRRDPDAVRDHKGLRHFSILVCEKLAKLGTSTYKEIADQLVQEANLQQESYVGYDEKNIRRRIYDALNVLMAMEIIGKERKAIRWKGFESALGLPLPASGVPAMPAAAVAAGTRQQEAALAAQLQASKERRARIAERRQTLEELAQQYVGLTTLTERNARPDFQSSIKDTDKISWPFLLLEAPARTNVECEMNETQDLVILTYSDAYQVHDHHRVLQRVGECAVQQFQHRVQARSADDATTTAATASTDSPPPANAKSTTPAPDDPFSALVSAAAASPKIKPVGSYGSRRAAAAAAAASNPSDSAGAAAAAGSASLAAASSPAAAAAAAVSSPLAVDAGDPRSFFSSDVWKLLPAQGTLRESSAAYAEALANGTLRPPVTPPAAAGSSAASSSGTHAAHANTVPSAWGAQQFVPPASSFLSPLLPSGMSGTGSQLGLGGGGREHSGGSVGALPSPTAGLSSAFLPSPVKLQLSSSGGSSLIGAGTSSSSNSMSQAILSASQGGWESTPSPPSPSIVKTQA